MLRASVYCSPTTRRLKALHLEGKLRNLTWGGGRRGEGANLISCNGTRDSDIHVETILSLVTCARDSRDFFLWLT